MGSEPPRPPGHASALINPPHYGSNMPWPPGQVTPHSPTPQTHCQQNTLPHRTKKCLRPTPPLRIISGTALRWQTKLTLYCSTIVSTTGAAWDPLIIVLSVFFSFKRLDDVFQYQDVIFPVACQLVYYPLGVHNGSQNYQGLWQSHLCL